MSKLLMPSLDFTHPLISIQLFLIYSKPEYVRDTAHVYWLRSETYANIDESHALS